MTRLATQQQVSPEFYFLHDGLEVGPCTVSELQAQVNTKQLRPSDLVWRAGTQQKREARHVPWLFPNTTANSAKPVLKSRKNESESAPSAGDDDGVTPEIQRVELSAGAHLANAWPILLFIVGGLIGGFLGGVAYAINTWISNTKLPFAVKIILNVLVGLAAFLIWLVIAVAIHSR